VHAQTTEIEVEFWLARDLEHLLGYAEWRNFTLTISKAKTACEVTGHTILDHFVDINKTIAMPKGLRRKFPTLCSHAMPVTWSLKMVINVSKRSLLPRLTLQYKLAKLS
jgi:hypothetical protein